jgi:hypothetical protein
MARIEDVESPKTILKIENSVYELEYIFACEGLKTWIKEVQCYQDSELLFRCKPNSDEFYFKVKELMHKEVDKINNYERRK